MHILFAYILITHIHVPTYSYLQGGEQEEQDDDDDDDDDDDIVDPGGTSYDDAWYKREPLYFNTGPRYTHTDLMNSRTPDSSLYDVQVSLTLNFSILMVSCLC